MGNTVCTDAVPFSLEDIFFSSHSSPRRCVAEVLPENVIKNVTRYQHNLKAFVFRHDAAVSASQQMDPKAIQAQPFDLSQEKIKLEESAAYVLVHVQCTAMDKVDSARNSTITPRSREMSQEQLDGAKRGDEKAPLWALILADVFSPRGLATALGTNIDKPTLFVLPSTASADGGSLSASVFHPNNASSRLSGFDFRYSVHILVGKKAHELVASVALLDALRIEHFLMESDEAVRRLFFNYKFSPGLSDAKFAFSACAPIGEVVSYRSFSRRSLNIAEVSRKNAILRILYNIRCTTSFPAILATPPSARGNYSHCSTPRGMFTPPSMPSLIHPHAPTQSLTSEPHATVQGPPVLEIPRLRFAAEAARQSAADLPLNAPRQYSSNLVSPWAQREGASARSNVTSIQTPRPPTTTPYFPSITALRLNEALQERGNNNKSNSENDEIRMTEERMEKLKAAAPEATEILPWLFVGGEEAAADRGQLLSKGITHIVNTVAFSIGNAHRDVFRYLELYLSDSPDEPIFSLFPTVIRFVEEARERGGKTFIHCHQGVSRSCSFVIAYVMWHHGLCYDRAFDFVRAKRKVCSPNTGFYVNLLLWENQLATPVFNKVYAYVPYTEYLFPFSFRLALAFRPHGKAHDNDDSQVVNPFVRVVHEKDEGYKIDPRLSYGILLGQRNTQSGGSATTLSSYFFSGSDCDAVVRQEAKEDWDAFLKYSFYQGKTKRSTNNKGEVVTYEPMPALERSTECLWDVNDIGNVVSERVFHRRRNNKDTSDGVEFPKPVLAQVECWNKLLSQKDMSSRLSNYLAEKQCVKIASVNRKRTRDEELERLSKVMPSGNTPRITLFKTASARNDTATSSAAADTVTAAAAASTHSSTNTYADTDAVDLASPTSAPPLVTSTRKSPATTNTAKAAGARGMASSVPTTTASNPVGGAVEIYMYPFTDSPLKDILDIADMETDACYAVIVPASAAAATTEGRHRVFLWFGCDCTVTEAEAWQAYRSSLKIDKDVRLSDQTVLESPLEEVAYDGDEPDDLILALE